MLALRRKSGKAFQWAKKGKVSDMPSLVVAEVGKLQAG